MPCQPPQHRQLSEVGEQVGHGTLEQLLERPVARWRAVDEVLVEPSDFGVELIDESIEVPRPAHGCVDVESRLDRTPWPGSKSAKPAGASTTAAWKR